MDVSKNLRQMVAAKPPKTAPGMPKPGSHIIDSSDGASVLVTRSVQLPGKVIAYCVDAGGNVRRVEL